MKDYFHRDEKTVFSKNNFLPSNNMLIDNIERTFVSFEEECPQNSIVYSLFS